MLAGGLDSFDWMKDRVKRPKVVVDLSQIKELTGVRDWNGGIEIGAMTTLTNVVRHPMVMAKFKILSRGGGSGGLSADSQSGHDRRQRLAGHALLVLPQRIRLLSRRRNYLLSPIRRRPSTANTPSSARTVALPSALRIRLPAFVALDAKMVIRSAQR